MRILALETSDQSSSVAALEADRVVAQRDLDPAVRSAVSLAPAIAEILREIQWRPRDVQLVAGATGPGSFTGLRVGVTTAKMFAYAAGAEVLGVNTLEVIACQSPDEVRQLWTVMDAQREQVFAGRFSRDDAGVWQWCGETQLLDNDVWLAQLSERAEHDVAVSGPVLAKLIGRLPSNVMILDQTIWMPNATTVGRLAWRFHQAGRSADVAGLVPEYFRRSAAEEKLRAK